MIFLVAHVAGHMVKVLLFELKIALRFADSEKGVFNCLLSTGALCVIMRHCSALETHLTFCFFTQPNATVSLRIPVCELAF